MYRRLGSFLWTVVGRSKPASTNLVVYCWSVRVWYFTPSISKISCAVRGATSQNYSTFRCLAVKRTWLLFGATWILFCVALLLFSSCSVTFSRRSITFPSRSVTFSAGSDTFRYMMVRKSHRLGRTRAGRCL